MIENIYIATKSGLCLFSRHYVLGTIDDDVITGLITAIYHMAGKSVKDNIQYMSFKDKRMYYQIQDPLIAIIVTEKNKKAKKYKKMVKKNS